MRPHEKVQKLLAGVEPVEWLYDGLNGKIIEWTFENGNDNPDPSVLAYLVDRNGKVFSSCPKGQAQSVSGFSGWLEEAIRDYGKKFPRTALPFDSPEVSMDGRTPTCETLDAAREAKKPVLLFFGREERNDDNRKARAQVKKSRKYEKSAFGSKKTAEAAEGWVLLRFDLGDRDHAALAKGLGIEAAPALLFFLPGEEKPVSPGLIKGSSLAYHLKRHGPTETR